ncbi:hypothetical protein T10_2240 [Trichinella papuae]|uniref:Uncharacterized protein n=1 Tax=Trichinella papuae TaxID=268474 RepID=A0A0V1MWF0_9BILA|nr:hypothetical protein T10_2240 [Trichinella papuae]
MKIRINNERILNLVQVGVVLNIRFLKCSMMSSDIGIVFQISMHDMRFHFLLTPSMGGSTAF